MKESNPTAGFLIINAGSSLLPSTKGDLSPVGAEAIVLYRACISCHHWKYTHKTHHMTRRDFGLTKIFIVDLDELNHK